MPLGRNDDKRLEIFAPVDPVLPTYTFPSLDGGNTPQGGGGLIGGVLNGGGGGSGGGGGASQPGGGGGPTPNGPTGPQNPDVIKPPITPGGPVGPTPAGPGNQLPPTPTGGTPTSTGQSSGAAPTAVQVQQPGTLSAQTAQFNPLAAPPVAGVAGYNASQAQGAPGAYAPNATAGTVDVATSEIDPATGTVRGQLESLKDSALFQRAAARGAQAAAARGLGNSSFGIGASEAALYDTALQIASPDAAAYNQTRLANQAAKNRASEVNAQLVTDVSKANASNNLQASIANQAQANQLAQFNAQSANESARFNAAQSQQIMMFNVQNLLETGRINQAQANQIAQFNASEANRINSFSEQLKADISRFNASQSNDLIKLGIDSATKERLAGIEAEYKNRLQASASSADLYRQTMSNIASIMQNKDLDPAAKKDAIDNSLQILKFGLSTIGGLNDIQGLGDLLSFKGSTIGNNYNTPPPIPPDNPQTGLPDTIKGPFGIQIPTRKP